MDQTPILTFPIERSFMTSIFVRTIGTFVGENRSWLLSDHGTEPGEMPTVSLDTTKFTEATHYPDGYFPSGLILGKITTTGLYGPYDPAANDGRQNPAGLLFGSLPLHGQPTIGAALVQHAYVSVAKLPANSGYSAAAATALPLIIWNP